MGGAIEKGRGGEKDINTGIGSWGFFMGELRGSFVLIFAAPHAFEFFGSICV